MRLRCLALVLFLPATAFAQQQSIAPVAVTKTDGKVSLQLEDAELSELVRAIGEITGKRFVIASPKLAKVKASVYAPEKVSAAEAYQAFLAVLSSNGLTVVPQAGFFKIVESQDIARQLTPIERGELPKEERYVTRIQRLTHLSAEDVSRDVLSKIATKDASIIPYPAGNLLIITETAANQRRMLEVLAAIDEAREEDKLWFQPLKYTPAKDAAKHLEEILDLKKNDGASGPLHVGKIVGLDGRFIIECQFSDIAPHGAKLRTVEVPTLPERFWLFDDYYGRALLARVAWRNGREMGVELVSDPAVTPLDEERLAQLSGKYYSL